ncbi:MAG TPA: hypothetical protein VL485_05635 [Ktedonobacteraceae bacterium]|nr:hypothetical protein [Ktedonobacteraceae bacterium]
MSVVDLAMVAMVGMIVGTIHLAILASQVMICIAGRRPLAILARVPAVTLTILARVGAANLPVLVRVTATILARVGAANLPVLVRVTATILARVGAANLPVLVRVQQIVNKGTSYLHKVCTWLETLSASQKEH